MTYAPNSYDQQRYERLEESICEYLDCGDSDRRAFLNDAGRILRQIYAESEGKAEFIAEILRKFS